MERERPEYLAPIPRKRWEFPWLGLWAVALASMAAAGIWLHLQTGAAWDARFNQPVAPLDDAAPAENARPAQTPQDRAARDATIESIRERRLKAAGRPNSDERCIDGVLFRRIPGGWENVPGHHCARDASR